MTGDQVSIWYIFSVKTNLERRLSTSHQFESNKRPIPCISDGESLIQQIAQCLSPPPLSLIDSSVFAFSLALTIGNAFCAIGAANKGRNLA